MDKTVQTIEEGKGDFMTSELFMIPSQCVTCSHTHILKYKYSQYKVHPSFQLIVLIVPFSLFVIPSLFLPNATFSLWLTLKTNALYTHPH